MNKPLRINIQFQDYEVFSEQLCSWNVDFIQLQSGEFNSELFQYGGNDFLLSSVQFNQSIHQRGIAPENLWTFGIPKPESSEFLWKNLLVQQDAIIVYAPGSELESITKPGFSVYTFSFPEHYIITVAKYLGISDIHRMLSTMENSVQKVIPSELDSFRTGMAHLLFTLKTSEENQLRNSGDLFPLDILSSILKLLQLGKLELERPSINSRFKVIQNVKELIHDSEPDKNITIPELIEIAQVSERTLCYAFKEYFGTSPKAYLKIHRLNQLRKALYSAPTNSNSVGKIAKQFGFWHMGQLAKDYQKLFNEKPLETLKK